MQLTEMRNPKTTHIDKMSVSEIINIINEENMNSVNAVQNALPSIEKAIDAVVDALNNGGRLIYAGAGTSGRLAVVDASECPPTFGVDYNTVVAVMAGGDRAIRYAAEGAEDSKEESIKALNEINITKNDILMGISASGNAEYVVSAIAYAKSLGCVTISHSSNDNCRMKDVSDIHIFTDTGAEVVTGSTRMKAGNAQKMVMNMISTAAMIKTGKVYENLMINLKPTNIKLKDRMVRIVVDILHIEYDEALKLLEDNEFSIREAIANYKGV